MYQGLPVKQIGMFQLCYLACIYLCSVVLLGMYLLVFATVNVKPDISHTSRNCKKVLFYIHAVKTVMSFT